MACWLGEAAVLEARTIFQQAGIASYATPEEAVRAFGMLVAYRRNQAQLMEAPAIVTGVAPAAEGQDIVAVRSLVQRVLAEGRDMLTEPEAKDVLAACGIPVVPTRSVGMEPSDASDAAEAIGFPVALKILSTDISHKSDVGGVVLNLASAADVSAAAQTMLARIRGSHPTARIDGFTVQAMVRRSHARELIVGASIDSVFGPVILFGQGGTSVEVVADRAVALPPLNTVLARALVERTRVAKLLGGFRDTPAADLDALCAVLVAVSQIVADVPEIAELDINPLILSHEGAIALDARIRVSAAESGGAEHFAIRPYPSSLHETVQWQGRTLTLRAIRPEDEAQHLAFLARLSPEDIRMRVFYSRRNIERSELARMTQIDYERETAIVAVAPGPDGIEETLGVARAMADPDNIDAEFGIIVRSDVKGTGLGLLLMTKLIRTLREHGTQRLIATVLSGNDRMLALGQELGFVSSRPAHADGTQALQLMLRTEDAGTGRLNRD
jgi:acetyltransferase